MAKQTTKGAESLRKALNLLDIVKRRREGMTPTAIAEESGLARPTVYRMVAALSEERFLQQDDSTKRLKLGPKLLELAQSVWSDTDLRSSAREELERLARETGALALLMVRSESMATCIELAGPEGNSQWRVGKTRPVTECAGGLAMLAYQDWGRLDADLERMDIGNVDGMKSQLGVTRSRFYAIDDVARSGEQSGVAAPIFDFSGRPVAAVCLYGNYASNSHDLGAAVVQAARTISKSRGGYPFGIEVPFTKMPRDNPDVHCLTETRCLIGDSPIVTSEGITLIDILSPAILSISAEEDTARETPLGEVVGALVDLGDGTFLAAQQTRLSCYDGRGRETWSRKAPGIPAGFRYNDGALDAKGRVWLGVMDMATSRGTGLLHMYRKIDAEPVTLPGFSLPNGIAFNESNDRMFVVDSMNKTLSRFIYDLDTGAAQFETKFDLMAEGVGRPSGLAGGPDGTFFSCHWDGAEVVQFDDCGQPVETFAMPVPRPSGICFDATNNRLVVSSARVRLSDADIDAFPLSGAVFSVDLA